MSDRTEFEVDPNLWRDQSLRGTLHLHVVLSVLTVGIWLPLLLVAVVHWWGWIRPQADSATVSLRGGRLTVGDPANLRVVPLDEVVDAGVQGGAVTVTVRGGQPLVLWGIRDPVHAVGRILDARDVQVAALDRLRSASTRP